MNNDQIALYLNDIRRKKCVLNGHVIKQFDPITLDGTTGRVMLGKVQLTKPRMTSFFTQVMAWADKMRRRTKGLNGEKTGDHGHRNFRSQASTRD